MVGFIAPVFGWLNQFPMFDRLKLPWIQPRFVLNPAPLLLKMVCEAMEQEEMLPADTNVRISS
jgi:hypothetical protein